MLNAAQSTEKIRREKNLMNKVAEHGKVLRPTIVDSSIVGKCTAVN
jgi:hypothetical protein